MSSAAPTTNYSGLGMHDGSREFIEPAGTYSGTTYKSLENFDMSPFVGTDVISATWYGYSWGVYGATSVPVTLHAISAPWNSTTVTYGTVPATHSHCHLRRVQQHG